MKYYKSNICFPLNRSVYKTVVSMGENARLTNTISYQKQWRWLSIGTSFTAIKGQSGTTSYHKGRSRTSGCPPSSSPPPKKKEPSDSLAALSLMGMSCALFPSQDPNYRKLVPMSGIH